MYRFSRTPSPAFASARRPRRGRILAAFVCAQLLAFASLSAAGADFQWPSPAGSEAGHFGGTLIGAASMVKGGPRDVAIRIDNSADSQGASMDLKKLNMDGNFSFAAWVKLLVAEGGFTRSAPHTIARFWGVAPSGEDLVLDLRVRDGSLEVYYTSPKRNLFANNLEVPLGQWCLLVVSVKDKSLSIFLNDQERTFPIDQTQSYQSLTLGTVSPGSLRGINGWIGEVRIFGAPLDAKEVAHLYQKGQAILTASSAMRDL